MYVSSSSINESTCHLWSKASKGAKIRNRYNQVLDVSVSNYPHKTHMLFIKKNIVSMTNKYMYHNHRSKTVPAGTIIKLVPRFR